MNFGAFVQLADGIEGLVHISEITAERRLNHPSEMLRAGQIVKAQMLAIDTEKRQIKLSMKQLIPTDIDEYIAEHKVGDKVSGRVIEHRPRSPSSNWATASAPPAASSADDSPRRTAAPRHSRAWQPSFDSPRSLRNSRAAGKATLPPPQPSRAIKRRPDPQLQNHQARPRSQENRGRVGIAVSQICGNLCWSRMKSYRDWRLPMRTTQQFSITLPMRWPKWSVPKSIPANMPRRARSSATVCAPWRC